MKPLLLIFTLACSADAAVTHIGLARGLHEVVWPTQNPYVIEAVTASQIVVGGLILRELKIRGHLKVAQWLGWTIIGIRATAIVHNIHQLGH